MGFVASAKDVFDNCRVCESKSALFLACLRADGAEAVFKASTAEEMSTEAYVYHGIWHVVIKAIIQRFLTENVDQEDMI